MSILPITLDDLLAGQVVESVRIEYKKSWSEPTLGQVIRTISAFANDFFNLNGGYIVIGVEEEKGRPKLPPAGLAAEQLDEIQKQIRGYCKRLEPEYQPLFVPEVYQNQHLMIVWCPAGDLRPYQAPKTISGGDKAYYIRQASETTEARGELLTQLVQMTAKIPFDDRRNFDASIDVISPTLVRNFLSDIGSDLVSSEIDIPDRELYNRLRIVGRVNGHEVAKNIALLFFVNNPERFFPGARIEIAQFGDNAGGDLIEEKLFRGPIHVQIQQTLDYLNTISTTLIKKIPNQAEAVKTVAFPYEAMEEAVVNAVYHRSYENNSEPVKIYLYPDRMEIISYPGPVPGLAREHFLPGASLPPVPNRNRRIGEFLKELRLAEGRGTGIPRIQRKMRENGSPVPQFEFDEGRTYFRVILSAHPQYVVIHALRESAYLWATGERQNALFNLDMALQRVPGSGVLLAQKIEYLSSLGDMALAEKIIAGVEEDPFITDRHLPYLAMAKVYLDHQNFKKASALLTAIPAPTNADELVELAVLHKRSGLFEAAHSLFATNFELIRNDPKAVHEFAQTKIRLSTQLPKEKIETKRKLTREAIELLRRAGQLCVDDPIRSAWIAYDLAKALDWSNTSKGEVEQAYRQAMALLPLEKRFQEGYKRWQKRNR